MMKAILNKINRFFLYRSYGKIYEKVKEFTMIPKWIFIDNLYLLHLHSKNIEGDVVECGVWKGGMSAGMAFLMKNTRKYYLFDSFEGLPDAKEIDGEKALDWQNDTTSAQYFDNCTADISYAQSIMKKTSVDHQIIKGWFDDTLPIFVKEYQGKIAILRLDGDWYESTMVALKNLYPKVVDKGIIILDDYHVWSGCSRAVHDFLSQQNVKSRIYQSRNGIAYIIKEKGDAAER